MKRKLSVLLASGALCLSTFAETEVVDGVTWTYFVSGGKASVGGGSTSSPAVSTATAGAITVPSTLGGYPVTGIASAAFAGCTELTDVTIPNGVTDIGTFAFDGCGLESVSIPNSTASIGDWAFRNCMWLKTVTIPNSVTSIGDYVFSGCIELKSATVGTGVKRISDHAFYGCTGLKSVAIGSGVRIIASCAFYGCTGLTAVTIPKGVKNIEHNAFYGCTGLTAVTIPNGVTSIGDYVFYGCSRLKSVAVGTGVPSIPYCAFAGCSALESVKMGSGVTNIDYRAFADCSALASVVIPPSVAKFGSSAFSGCSALKSVKMRRTEVPWSMFSGCPEDMVITYWKSTLTLKPNKKTYGTVSGGGTRYVGAKVTIKAKAKTGRVFAGWFTDKACTKALNPPGYDNRKPKVKIDMPAKKTTIYAKFVTTAAAKKSLKFSSSTKKLAKTAAEATAGVSFSLKLGISSASLPTVTAKGLPKGLSINKTTGMIKGSPTKPGSYTAKVTVKDAAGNKISQKVKITVAVPSWAKGTFYGDARPKGDMGDPTMAYLKFTAGSNGKVSGKVTYKGKEYSFTSSYSLYTAKESAFTPEVEIGKYTFKPGPVTVKAKKLSGSPVVEATTSQGDFYAQKKPDLVKAGKELGLLVGTTCLFTDADEGSGLPKSGDELLVAFSGGDMVTVTGTVNGKAMTALKWPLALVGKKVTAGETAYWLSVDIIDASLKYSRRLTFVAGVDGGGNLTRLDKTFEGL